MIAQGIYQFLLNNTGVNGIVAGSIFEQAFPKDADPPSVVFYGITSTPVQSLDGEDGLRIRRYQFDCYSSSARGASVLQEAVRSAFVAVATGTTFPDGSVLQAARIMMELDKPFEPGPGGTVYCSVLDIELSFIPSA